MKKQQSRSLIKLLQVYCQSIFYYDYTLPEISDNINLSIFLSEAAHLQARNLLGLDGKFGCGIDLMD